MPKEYRIKEVIDPEGQQRFYVQREGVWWGWNTCSSSSMYGNNYYSTLKEAEEVMWKRKIREKPDTVIIHTPHGERNLTRYHFRTAIETLEQHDRIQAKYLLRIAGQNAQFRDAAEKMHEHLTRMLDASRGHGNSTEYNSARSSCHAFENCKNIEVLSIPMEED